MLPGNYYREETALIMSGVESDNYWDIAINAGIKRLLVSYHYIQRKGKKFLRDRLKDHPEIKIMIDSGAYTFINEEDKYFNKSLNYWEEYLDKYTAFIRDNKEFIFCCVELDIGDIVGLDIVDRWRKEYFEPLEKEGIAVCYVWHSKDGMDYWKYLCQKHDYIGFSLSLNSLDTSTINRMMTTAKLNDAVVHGFAVTDMTILSQVPFYTCDSTTWLVGTKYGELNWFDGRKMKRLKKQEWKRQYKMKFIKLGANWSLAEKENPYELIRINLLVFKEAEKHIQQRLRAKMYWKKWGNSMPSKLKPIAKIKPIEVKEEPKKPGLKKIFKRPNGEEIPTIQLDRELLPSSPLKKNSFTKGVPEREDLQGKSKFEEFSESSKTVTEENLIFPPIEWFEGDCEDYKEYCKKLNIQSDDKESSVDLLKDFTVFIQRIEEELNDIPDDTIDELCEYHLYNTFSSREESIEQVRQFYLDNALGVRKDFMADEEYVEAKERDDYLTEDEYDVVDMNQEELEKFLPLMPEVDEYDVELNRSGISIVRDEKGKFLKGQKKVRKPKNIYSDKFPKLACDTCYKAGDCPQYKPGFVCGYIKLFKKFDTRNMDDLMDAMSSMVGLNLERMQRLAIFEIMDGGMTDPNLTSMIDQNMRLIGSIKDLTKANLIAQQRTTINADGTTEVVTEVRGNGNEGGLLDKLLKRQYSADNRDKESDKDDAIDV